MILFISRIRALAFVFACAFLAACTQTASTSHHGSTGLTKTHGTNAKKKSRETKLSASRKRAAKARKLRREAFLKNRAERRAKRKAKREARRNGAALSAKSKTSRKKSIKNKKSRRTAKVSTKSKKRTSKSKTAAYAGGRARKISVNKPWKCVPNRLKSVINEVSRRFGPVVINSTHRTSKYNRMVGGKRKSYHLRCQAVDFTVKGRTKGLTRFLARHPKVGGWKRYPSGFYHIDTGPKRTW